MTTRANAQSFYGFYGVVSNVGEQTLLAKGNQQINDTVRSEIKHQTKTGVIQNAMAAEFSKMRKWEQQYNKYLKTATNFASSLKAATHIYDSGMRILLTLSKLRKAASNNPQGIVATLSMNNLYMETLLEFVSVGNLLKNAIAKGGKTNMLTGAERSKSLWELERSLSDLPVLSIGTNVFKGNLIKATTAVVIGSVIYKACVAIAIEVGLPATDLKLITAVLFLIILIISMDRKKKVKKA